MTDNWIEFKQVAGGFICSRCNDKVYLPYKESHRQSHYLADITAYMLYGSRPE